MQIQTKKYHNFKINRICATVFLKWTDFRTLFSAGETFSAWTFRHRDFSAPEHFGTWIFWPLAKQYGRFSTNIFSPVLLCQNVHVPKCSHAEMFLCRKFLVPKNPHAEKSPCRDVPVLKCPSAGTSAVPNGARAKMFLWFFAEMTLAKMFHVEMVCRHPKYIKH